MRMDTFAELAHYWHTTIRDACLGWRAWAKEGRVLLANVRNSFSQRISEVAPHVFVSLRDEALELYKEALKTCSHPIEPWRSCTTSVTAETVKEE